MRKVNPLWLLMLVQIGLILYGFYRLTLTRLNVRWFEVVWVVLGPVILMSFFGIYTYYNIKNAYKEPSEVRTSDRCPVCGAFVYSHPNTIDEPFAGVDPVAISDIKRMLLDLKEKNIGILITDHNVFELLRLIDRGYIINHGSVLAEGTPKDLLKNNKVREVYIGYEIEL